MTLAHWLRRNWHANAQLWVWDFRSFLPENIFKSYCIIHLNIYLKICRFSLMGLTSAWFVCFDLFHAAFLDLSPNSSQHDTFPSSFDISVCISFPFRFGRQAFDLSTRKCHSFPFAWRYAISDCLSTNMLCFFL